MRLFRPSGSASWAPRWAAVVLFAALCAVIAYWVLRISQPAVRIAPADTLAGSQTEISTARAQALFGAAGASDTPVVEPVSSDFHVVGVIADQARGAAIISIEGRPGAAYGVGMAIDDQHTLESVSAEEVVILRGSERIHVAAPALSSAAILTSGQPEDDAQGNSQPAVQPAVQLLPLPPAGAAAAVQGEDEARPEAETAPGTVQAGAETPPPGRSEEAFMRPRINRDDAG